MGGRSSGGALRAAPGGFECLLDKRPAGTGPVRAFTEDLAEGTATALAVEQAEQVAGDVLELRAARELALDIGPHRTQHLGTARKLAAEPGHVEPVQQPGVVVGRASEHGAIDVGEVRAGF